MDGVLPVAFSLPDAMAQDMGRQMQTGLTPFLNQMNDILRRRDDELSRIGHGVMNVVLDALAGITGLQQGVQSVQVVNLAFLELMSAGSFAFLVLIFLKLEDIHRRLGFTNVRLGDTNILIQTTNSLLRQISLQISITNQRIFSLYAQLISIQNSVTNLLTQIATQIQIAPSISGQININFDLGKGGDLLKALAELLKVILVDHLLALAEVLKALADVLKALPNLTGLIEALTKLTIVLVATRGKGIAFLLIGLLILAGFVYLLSVVLDQFSDQALAAIPPVISLIDALRKLADAFTQLTAAQLVKIAAGFGIFAIFLLALGAGLSQLDAELLNALPSLSDFIDKLAKLPNALKEMSAGNIAVLIFGLAALGGFVYLLGLGLSQLDAELLNALPKLSGFVDSLMQLATKLGGFDLGQLLVIAGGLALLVMFVGALGLILTTFLPGFMQAGPALAMVVDSLAALTETLAVLNMEQLFVLGLALILLAGFAFALGAAFMLIGFGLAMATPGLNALAAVLQQLNSLFDSVVGAAGRLADAIRSIPTPNISLPSLPSFQSGGVVTEPTLAFLHPGERVLSASQNQALESGALSPASIEGASAAVPVGAAAPTGQQVDQSIHLGGISITINTERLEADAAEMLTDEIAQQLQEKMAALDRRQAFGRGELPAATS